MITLADNSKTYTVQYNSLDGNRYEITATKERFGKYRIKIYLLTIEDNIEHPMQQVVWVNGNAYHSIIAKDQNYMKTWVWAYVDNDEKRNYNHTYINPFEQYEDLGRQRVALNERIEDALREWVKDHAEEINPEEPQAVCFNEWWKIGDVVFVGVTFDQEGNDYHSFRFNQEEILKYFE